MPLPSQAGQQKSRRSHMYRRRRGRRRPVLIVLIALLGLAIVVWFMRGSSEGATDQQVSAADEPATASEGPVVESPPPAIDQSPRITMGRPIDDRADASQPLFSQPSRSLDRHERSTPTEPDEPREDSSSSPREQVTQPSAPQPEQAASSQSEPEARSATRSSSRAAQRMELGMELQRSNRPIEARRTLTRALHTQGIHPDDARTIRETLTELNEKLIFSPAIIENDPFVSTYTIQSGDTLARITSRQNLSVDWRLIQRINRISRPERIHVGQTLKLITGPFHAIVHKSEYRMDIYLGEGTEQVYVRSFSVGLGEYNSTPVGLFRISNNSKLIDPAWTNPRTGEQFASGDPDNPIGSRWIGMEGVSEAIRGMRGYGIHGTIEPDSIGTQQSMGCIRLGEHDVELVYELLVEEVSTVEVVE